MIFNSAERDAIFRTQVRKACESSGILAHHEIPHNAGVMIQNHLYKEVSRCSQMLRIADNDFTHIRETPEVLGKDPLNLPLNVYDEYLGIMDEKTRENESHFMFLYAYMLGYMDHIRNGIGIADQILSGGNPINYSEILILSRTRDIYEACEERCRPLEDCDDVPYAQALEYIECAVEEISILIRVATGKVVELDEISDHLEWAEGLDSAAFRNICMIDMPPNDLSLIERFESEWERHIDILVG